MKTSKIMMVLLALTLGGGLRPHLALGDGLTAIEGGDLVYETQEGTTAYRVHVFTNTGTATLTVNVESSVECLLVGGGGGGGSRHGGGGGAGGVVSSNAFFLAADVYTVTVGAGGAGYPDSSWAVAGSEGGTPVWPR